MSTLLFQEVSVPQTADEVRSTVQPMIPNVAAEADDAPEFSEWQSDRNGALTGLATRQLSGATTLTQKFVPSWLRRASFNHNAIIDNQVSTSGTAAQREEAGETGHGTMQYTESLEPIVRDGARFGNEYFEVNARPIQDGAGDYMQDPSQDHWSATLAQSQAVDDQRLAAKSTLYANFWGGK